jgi:primosomal protein N'
VSPVRLVSPKLKERRRAEAGRRVRESVADRVIGELSALSKAAKRAAKEGRMSRDWS